MNKRNKKRGRGRPPQELVLSEGGVELLSAALSHAREAVDLLEACEANPDWKNFQKARRLLSLAGGEIGDIISRKNNLETALGELDLFVENRVEFSESARETIQTVYEEYVECCGITETDIEIGESLSRNKFTKMMLRIYGAKIREDVKRVNGGVARCFIGLRLKDLGEAENDG
jgi:hypothetical protein